MEKMEIRMISDVVEFIFGPTTHLVFDYKGQPGLETGYDEKSNKVVAYMSYNFSRVYQRILKGLQEKPLPGRFSVDLVDEVGKVTPICDPRVKNATLAEIVQWVWEKYYAHLQQDVPLKAAA